MFLPIHIGEETRFFFNSVDLELFLLEYLNIKEKLSCICCVESKKKLIFQNYREVRFILFKYYQKQFKSETIFISDWKMYSYHSRAFSPSFSVTKRFFFAAHFQPWKTFY